MFNDKSAKWASLPLSYGSSPMGIARHTQSKLDSKQALRNYREIVILYANKACQVIRDQTNLSCIGDLFKKIVSRAFSLNMSLYNWRIPSLLGNTIIVKYRTMKKKRIARQVSIIGTELFYKHRVTARLTPRQLDKPKINRALYANIIQSMDSTVLFLTTLAFRSHIKGYPFLGLWVHDSISLHSMFEDILKHEFRIAHHDLYRFSRSSLDSNLKIGISRKAFLDNLLDDFDQQFAAEFDVPFTPSPAFVSSKKKNKTKPKTFTLEKMALLDKAKFSILAKGCFPTVYTTLGRFFMRCTFT